MTVRRLVAWLDKQRVGAIEEEAGLWRFVYDEAWTRFPLSPALDPKASPIVDGATKRPVQWYFDNLLPEEGQRALLAKDAKIDQADAMGLLAYYGRESAGALTLLPESEFVPDADGLRPLQDARLSERIRQLPALPLTHAATKRMSLAGAQHKLAVVVRDGVLYEPLGSEPSTHILKPDHPDQDFAHSVINEWFVMKLAASMGLEVPWVDRRYVPEPVYLVARFDRQDDGGQTRRIHAIDACQLLGLAPLFKYKEGSIDALRQLADQCQLRAAARLRMFRWLAFNVLVGNGDAHLKNLSFLVDERGVNISPHYDLLSTSAYDTKAMGKDAWPQLSELAWTIRDKLKFADMSTELLVAAGSDLGINSSATTRILMDMAGRIDARAEVLLANLVHENRQIVAARPELGVTLAGEERCIRAIVHIVIREMSSRLRQTRMQGLGFGA
ncbi:HipA domain-containing protein [Dyella flagellata]|uniref:Kinase Y4mE n=1 Tax=Dyella flagellata TaxID=1867833 RepID=A0ABQ5XDC9_9GAMM|nr:HipA domain-containing protein [Dyella flagellata]GLQ89695.1 putative kinase Y4mE [Dyella flagellata]